MTERVARDERARSFFDGLWRQGDPWELERSGFERDRYAALLRLLDGGHYPRALEIGCGAGHLTRQLVQYAERILALDVSREAIARARAAHGGGAQIEFRVANAMEFDPGAEGPWDLIVLSETIYYLGWLYPFFDVAWFASELFRATRVGGRLLLANTQGHLEDALLLPCIIHTYRDLFANVGYQLHHESIFRGTKNGAELEVLMSLFVRQS